MHAGHSAHRVNSGTALHGRGSSIPPRSKISTEDRHQTVPAQDSWQQRASHRLMQVCFGYYDTEMGWSRNVRRLALAG